MGIDMIVIGTGPSWRGTMFGGVRTDSQTRPAPDSARSAAISAPVLPAPTTSTSLPAYGAGVRYSRGVDDVTAERLLPRPGRANGERLYPVAMTTCRAGHLSAVGVCPPEPDGALESLHLGAEPRLDAVMLGVAADVVGHVVLGDPLAEARRHPQPRQRGLDARRVEVQSVVAVSPRVTGGLAAIEHQGVHALPSQAGRDRKTRGTRAHHQHLSIHARPPPASR